MESAAIGLNYKLIYIGKVCFVSGVDFYILKSISDVEGSHEEKNNIVE
jgi:hypothetical protein